MKRKFKNFLCSSITLCVLFSSPFLFSCYNAKNTSGNTPIDKTDLFKIEDGLVAGFNPDLTYNEIVSKIGGNKLIFPTNVKGIKEDAFYLNGRSTIPANVTEIEFSNKDWIFEIGANAFRQSSITHFNIPKNLSNIRANAFCESKIQSLTYEDSDVDLTIYSGAFEKCPITNLVLPRRLLKLGEKSFGSMNELESIDTTLFNALPKYWSFSKAFDNFPSGHNLQIWIKYDVYTEGWANFFKNQGIVAPKIISSNRVLSIEHYSPENCVLKGFNQQLKQSEIDAIYSDIKFKIPAEVTTIASSAFSSQNPLVIPKNVDELVIDSSINLKQIEFSAFTGAPFKNIKILCSNECNFGTFAFSRCNFLEKIELNPQEKLHLNANVFADDANLTEVILDPQKCIFEDSFVFDNNPKLSKINFLGDFVEIPYYWNEEWGKKQTVEKYSGTFYCKSQVQANAVFYSFQNSGFRFDSQGWGLSYTNLNVFNIKNNIVYGVNPILAEEEIKWLLTQSQNKIIVPDNVVEIADNAFYDSEKDISTLPIQLKNLEFTTQSCCIRIGKNAFRKADKLETLILPPHLEKFEDYAFAETGLTTISYENVTTSPALWSRKAFSNIKSTKGIFVCITKKTMDLYHELEKYSTCADDEAFYFYFCQSDFVINRQSGWYFKTSDGYEFERATPVFDGVDNGSMEKIRTHLDVYKDLFYNHRLYIFSEYYANPYKAPADYSLLTVNEINNLTQKSSVYDHTSFINIHEIIFFPTKNLTFNITKINSMFVFNNVNIQYLPNVSYIKLPNSIKQFPQYDEEPVHYGALINGNNAKKCSVDVSDFETVPLPPSQWGKKDKYEFFDPNNFPSTCRYLIVKKASDWEEWKKYLWDIENQDHWLPLVL